MYDNESFEEASWLSMFAGFDVTPKRFDIRAKNVPLEIIERNLSEMKNSMNTAAKQAMTHQQFIDKHCLAERDI